MSKKYIDAEQKITVQVYDEEHEEWTIKETTIECALDFWSNEGCPPAADVQEVRHGWWEHLGGDEWCCTACGHVITTEGSWERPWQKYC